MFYRFILAIILCFGVSLAKDTYVNGYYKSNGTYVQPHYRTSPNSSVYDNYSTKGNVNPYTGEKGYKDPYNNNNSYGSSNNSLYGGSSSYGKSLYGSDDN